MGTEFARSCAKEENMEVPSIPPGFESLSPFTLKKVGSKEMRTSYSTSVAGSESQITPMVTESYCSEDRKVVKSLRRRASVNYGQLENSSGDESDSEQVQSPPLKPQLPKGVIRGCDKCADCQKVSAKWHPKEARRPDIQDAPIFYPTEEEFDDPLKYIASIRPKAEAYGICRVVPPKSWKPPCPLKQRCIWENAKFTTRIQRIDKLQNRDSAKKALKVNYHKKRKRRRCMKTGIEHGSSNGENRIPEEVGINEAESFGFETGPEFTLHSFQHYADDFKTQYFRNENSALDPGGEAIVKQEHWAPLVEEIEGEYWRMVERPTEEIEVLYGADLETGVFGSGFPKQSHEVDSAVDEKYISSGWNLNNFPRLPGSVLSYESSDISGVLVPWLYIGMCFSSFCWHVEDHHLYSLNYMHWGEPKIWYGVPGADALKLESAMRKHLPDLFDEQPDLLHKLVTQLSPSILKNEGVPVYRCVQNAGEFVLTFPRAYHAGFNSGFNCAEAVNVAPVDWLPHGQNAIELYRDQSRKTSVSHDKLLLGAAREAVNAHWELNILRKNTSNNLRWKDACGKDGILFKALKARVEMERVKREFLCNSSQALKMESTFDATSERECSVCLFDLHLSAAGCHYCSPDKYACLNHAKQLCACSWGAKFFLYRYDMKELNLLLEALEGKLVSVYRWAKLDLGVLPTSYLSKENLQASGNAGKTLSSPEGAMPKVMTTSSVMVGSKQQKEVNSGILNPSKPVGGTFSTTKVTPPGGLVALDNKVCSSLNSSPNKVESSKNASIIQSRKELAPLSETRGSPGDLSVSRILIPKSETNHSLKDDSDVILLSDDEAETPRTSCSMSKTPKNSEGKDHLVHNGSCLRDTGPENSMIDAPMMSDNVSSSQCIKAEDLPKCETDLGLYIMDNSLNQLPSCSADVGKDVVGFYNQENSAYNMSNSQPCSVDRINNENTHQKFEFDVSSRSMENSQNVSCNPSASQNYLDRHYRQKGPRIAKVVRRINCNVEALEFGVVQPRKLWSDSHAIYPKGFRSRVRYINVLDPTNMCYYVSEILDAGRDEPLFMVSVEGSPNEVFVHMSASRCWEMVRDRVNQEIARQHKLGKTKLPPLQPPGSLDGMEMFGFSSPAIVQGIQAMDSNRVCIEYWKSRPLMQFPAQYNNHIVNHVVKSEESNNQQIDKTESLPDGVVDNIIDGMLKKVDPEELNALYSILSNNNNSSTASDQGLLIQRIKHEISKRAR